MGVALESLTAVALPIAVMVACLSPWITAVLFGQGEFLASGRLGATAIAMAVFMIGFVVQGRNQLCFQVAFATGRSGIVNRVQIIGHVIRAILLMPFVWAWSFVGLVLAQVTMNVVVAAAFWALSPRDWAHNHRPIRGGAFRGVGAALPVAAVPLGAFLLLRAWLPDPLALAPLTRIGMLLLMTLGWLALGLLVAFVVRLPALMRLLPRNRSAA